MRPQLNLNFDVSKPKPKFDFSNTNTDFNNNINKKSLNQNYTSNINKNSIFAKPNKLFNDINSIQPPPTFLNQDFHKRKNINQNFSFADKAGKLTITPTDVSIFKNINFL